MRIIERAHLLFKAAAKAGQPFTPSDTDRMMAEAIDVELAERDRNHAMLHRQIKELENRISNLKHPQPERTDDA